MGNPFDTRYDEYFNKQSGKSLQPYWEQYLAGIKAFLKEENYSVADFVKECEKREVGEDTVKKHLYPPQKPDDNKVKKNSYSIRKPNDKTIRLYFKTLNELFPKRYAEEKEKESDSENKPSFIKDFEMKVALPIAMSDIYTEFEDDIHQYDVYRLWVNRDFYFSLPLMSESLLFDISWLSKESRIELLAFIEKQETKVQSVIDTSKEVWQYIDMRDNEPNRTKKMYNEVRKRGFAASTLEDRLNDFREEKRRDGLRDFSALPSLIRQNEMTDLEWNLLIAYTVATHNNLEVTLLITEELLRLKFGWAPDEHSKEIRDRLLKIYEQELQQTP